MAEEVLIVLIPVILVPLYMLPAFIAAKRRCNLAAGIVMLDLFFGWSIALWVIALVWAMVDEVRPKIAPDPFSSQTSLQERPGGRVYGDS